MKFTLALTLTVLSASAFSQTFRSDTGCEVAASKIAEAIARTASGNKVDASKTDTFMIEKTQDGKSLIYDIQVGGRIASPYFKVQVKNSKSCKFENAYQDQGRG